MSDEKLNNELLEEDVQSTEAPKRNSKDDLIAKIINICADNNMELEHSNSKLRRMTKDQLCKILAEKLECSVKSQMAAQVGAKANAPDSVIALGALKMIGKQRRKGSQLDPAEVRVPSSRVHGFLKGPRGQRGGGAVPRRNRRGERHSTAHRESLRQAGNRVGWGPCNQHPLDGQIGRKKTSQN